MAKSTKSRLKGKSAAKPARRDNEQVDDWLADESAVALPNAQLEEIKANRAKRRRMATLVKAGVISGPIALILAFVGMGLAAQAGVEAREAERGPMIAPISVQSITSPGRYIATAHLEAWLAAVPNPVPGGRVISWDGAEEMGNVAGSSSTGEVFTTLETFTLVDGVGQPYTAQVLVGNDPAGGSVVISGPSLMKTVPPAQNLSVDSAWDDVRDTDPTESVVSAVQSWAEAYTSGDGARLRLVVGDPEAGHAYLPLSGVASVTSSVLETGTTDEVLTDDEGRETPASRMIARVEMLMQWEGRAEVAPVAPVTMDLLIVEADTGAPRVVAWGAPGTGTTLVQYGNAIAAVDRGAVTPADPNEQREYDDGGLAPTEAPTQSPGQDGTDPGGDSDGVSG